MAVDPIIARGAELPDLMRPLILAEEIKNRRETNKLYAVRQQMEQQRYAQEQQAAQQAQTAEAEKQQAIAVYHAAKAGNPMARNFALKKLSETTPGIFQGMDPDTAWAQIEPVMRQTLGIEGDNELTLEEREGPFGSKVLVGGGRFQVVEPPKPAGGNTVIVPPAGQREFEYFQSLSPEEQQRYLNVKRSNATPEAAAATEGAKVEARGQAERKLEEPKRREKARQITATIDNTFAEIDKATKSINWANVGPIGAIAKAVPGTPAYDLQQTLLTIRANIGFDRLQAMRDASPTGGALGQVAIQELAALQASIASLDQAQTPGQLRANLEKVRRHYDGWKRAVTAGSQDEPQSGVVDFNDL